METAAAAAATNAADPAQENRSEEKRTHNKRKLIGEEGDPGEVRVATERISAN
jgi:hypothetical protein